MRHPKHTASTGIAAIRVDVRRWLTADWDPAAPTREWWARLADSGWAFPAWPEPSVDRDLPFKELRVGTQR